MRDLRHELRHLHPGSEANVIMSLEFELDGVLEAPPVVASSAEVAGILQRRFGLSGSMRALASERDANVRIDTVAGPYLLKITNPAEDPAVTDLQTAALKHLEKSMPLLRVPRIVPALDGSDQPQEILGNQAHIVRLMSFMPGTPLSGSTVTQETRVALGASLGLLDAGLDDFEHPASEHTLLWNAADPLRVRGAVRFVDDRAKRSLAEVALDQYERNANPVMNQLRKQVIHNDANPHNILIDDVIPHQISGIIDFGDLVKAPLVSEVSTALAYLEYGKGEPLRAIADVVRSYHANTPLLSAELDVVFDLVRARQVLVGVISAWRAARQPDNSVYILRNSARAWQGLQFLHNVPREKFRGVLSDACRGDLQ